MRVIAGALAVSLLVVYANSLSNPFLLDDQAAVLNNPQIRDLWPLSTPLSPPDESPVAGRPLVNLTFAANYALGGLDVRGYHAGNLLIHLAAALVLMGFIRRALMLPSLAPRFGARATPIAWACAAIWALHPLHTEIVNYVSQRTTALMGLCYLATLYASVRAAERREGPWTAVAVAACTAGMASKETMVTAPLLVVLFDRMYVYKSLGEAVWNRLWLYTGLAGSWVVLAALMASRERTTVGFDTGVTPWGYLLNQFPVIAHYLRLAVWPEALVVDYGLPRMLDLSVVWVPGALVIGLGAATLAALRWRPKAGFAAAAFFILLSPTSSIVPIATEVGAERRMYLPLAALVVLAVCLSYRGAGALLAWRAQQQWAQGRRAFYASVTLVVLVCSLLAMRVSLRNREFQSPVALARSVVEHWPHGRAYFMLANALLHAGREDDAIRYFRRSVVDFPGGHFALGTMLVARDRDAGVAELQAFLQKMPGHSAEMAAREVIGRARFEQGRFGEAAEELGRVAAASPRNVTIRALFGEALLKSGRPAEAEPHLQFAVAVLPRNSHLHNMLGAAFADTGRYDAARARFEEARRLAPGDPAPVTNLERLNALAP
jgi:tetratricopeptide (TPR) repeat protein